MTEKKTEAKPPAAGKGRRTSLAGRKSVVAGKDTRSSATKDLAEGGSDAASTQDMLMVLGKAPSGHGYQVLRSRKKRLEAGELRPLEHGKAIDGELVSLRAKDDAPGVYDVDVHYQSKNAAKAQTRSAVQPSGSAATAARGRPAQVASAGYRKNWSKIFGAGSAKNGLSEKRSKADLN